MFNELKAWCNNIWVRHRNYTKQAKIMEFFLSFSFIMSATVSAVGNTEVAEFNNKMKVVIIGGGAAGLWAALAASAQGAEGRILTWITSNYIFSDNILFDKFSFAAGEAGDLWW